MTRQSAGLSAEHFAGKTIAFYAPMKAPTHPVPSGDRAMARGLLEALGGTAQLVSDLRIYDGRGDSDIQAHLIRRAEAETRRLLHDLPADLSHWVSYHNYYKAPDLIGPAICCARNIPYVLIESSRAKKRLTGPWADFAARAEAASDAADLIFYLTEQDQAALLQHRPDGQILRPLRPFLARADLPAASSCSRSILSAGMMRGPDKLASYELIAQALHCLAGTEFQIELAGDGPDRGMVEQMMAPFGARVRFLGQLDHAEMAHAYDQAGLFFWPGVNEAFGMVFLEAQSHGLAVVTQDRPGLRDVMAPGQALPRQGGAQALADRLRHLLRAPDERRALGDRARDHIAAHHLLGAARTTLRAGLAEVAR